MKLYSIPFVCLVLFKLTSRQVKLTAPVKMFKSTTHILVAIIALLVAMVTVSADPLPLNGIFDQTLLGIGRIEGLGAQTNGPISIRESTVGDIINITININGTVESNISLQLVNVLVTALNDFGNYGITMSNVRTALLEYMSKHHEVIHG